jgi:hypothetical protein
MPAHDPASSELSGRPITARQLIVVSSFLAVAVLVSRQFGKSTTQISLARFWMASILAFCEFAEPITLISKWAEKQKRSYR